MSDRDDQTIHRRDFLQTASAMTGATALVIGAATPSRADDDAASSKLPLPRRVLGRTGVEVSILNQGTWRSPSLDRLLRFSFASGVRYFDTAKSYGSEAGIGKWFEAMPEVRKQIFLVTKDHPNTPKALIAQLDTRLAALKTDHVDLLFIHALGDNHPDVEADWPKSKEFKETVAAIKKTGKARFVGFSTHHARRAEYIKSAAEGGFVDAIMVQNTAWLDKDTPLNKALDAAHKAGIGLISMKQIAGPNPEAFLAEVPKKAPELIAKGLTPYGALLHAIWSDERFSTVCVSMRNTDQIRENTRAARMFAPLKAAQIDAIRGAFLASSPSLCADCDGRCSVAGGTKAALGDLTRFLTYYERHGFRGEARRSFAGLPAEARDWRDADLAAAQAACPSGLDFAALLPRVDRDLA